MSDEFKKLPTLADLATRVSTLHADFCALNLAMGQQVGGMRADMEERDAITDTAIEELSLKVAFLMNIIRAKRPLNSGIADVNGQVQFEQVSALDLYLNGGRAKLVEERQRREAEFMKGLNAQSVPTAPAGDGQPKAGHPDTETAAADDADHALIPPTKIITH